MNNTDQEIAMDLDVFCNGDLVEINCFEALDDYDYCDEDSISYNIIGV